MTTDTDTGTATTDRAVPHEPAAARVTGHWVAGAARGTGTIERRSPATGAHVASFADGTKDDVAAAVAAANSTFRSPAWKSLAHSARADLLGDLAVALSDAQTELAGLDSEEVGKPLAFAMGDIGLGIAHVQQAAAIARTAVGESFPGIAPGYLALAERRAVGVVGLIIPWNFPGLIALQKLPYALAAGCTIVIKPSEFTSSSALRIAEICDQVGFPAGAVNVVTGYGHTAGQALIEHPDVAYVSFTGSTRTGRLVAATAAQRLARTGLELGGKTANVVFADADLEAAAQGAVFGAFANQGESCVATSRLLVEAAVADQFVDAVVDKVRQLRVGMPLDPEADLGALIHHRHRDAVHAAVHAAVAAGATVATGGAAPSDTLLADGAFYRPTVVTGVRSDTALFQDEVFGPVLAVTTFETEEEAVELANATTYGLAHSLWTRDLDRAFRVGQQLEAGTVWVNTCSDGSPQLAFGGMKASGFGRDAGVEGFREFTEYRTLQVRSAPRSSPFERQS